MASAGFSLEFSISEGVVKIFLKTMQKKKKKLNKTVMLARSKLNSIESKISETLINNEISHEDFMTISQRSATEKKKLLKKVKKDVFI